MNSKSPRHKAAAGCRRAFSIALVVLACALPAGCVHRRFTVRTNPPGARLYVDDYEIGTTPISHDFVYYGTRKIRLVKDGYETLTILQPMPTPWYDYPGIDFVTENLIPYDWNDHRVLDYQMLPETIVPTEQLLTRADELRRTKNPAVPGAVPPGVPAGAAPGVMGPPAGAPPDAAPGALPPGMIPPGTPQPGAIPTGPPPGGAPQYGPPAGGTPTFGAPQYGVPQNSVSPGGAGPSTFQPSGPPSGAAPGAPGTGPTTLPTSPPAWPTTPPPAVGAPAATSGPPSNYSPPGY